MSTPVQPTTDAQSSQPTSNEPAVSAQGQPAEQDAKFFRFKPAADEWQTAVKSGHVDAESFVCNLCERALGDVEKLEKHVRVSQLHKDNYASARQKFMATLDEEQLFKFEDAERKFAYRDRAAERREQFGQPDKPVLPGYGSHGKAPASWAEQPTKDGIKDDNIGNKMLKSMGWVEGQGLGRNAQGITAPVEAVMHAPGSGIGAAPVLVASEVTDSHRSHIMSAARHRFNKLD